MNYAQGQRFTLKVEHGHEPGATNPAFHPDGVSNADGTFTIHPLPDGFPLRVGMVGTVDEVVPAEVAGAGNDVEEHVVLEFEATEPRPHLRRVSFTESQMDSMFDEVNAATVPTGFAGVVGDSFAPAPPPASFPTEA